ncbi:hypothetical protein PR202_ga14712 [Eleusine coracana subsp. coracana]|uniref:DNA-binding protein RHL1 n=1 Tax=Eleusine coracana subsp. coracana TaxID=191504 RepID=A0AAV5CI40_ELECO|nr:hypothetical protein PR202_ga14712 [Eleusine coracana subsp. coracana]
MVKKASAAPADAEADERRRLRSLAFSNGLLQRGDPAATRKPLAPSTAVTRLQGRDIVRRGSQRKSRFLFSFPGLLAPVASGGRIGELSDLGTKNPLLYLEFPQGRMKLFGTHVYPKNKYLTLQMTRSAKGVVCEDVFESLDAAAADFDFRGGAGAAVDEATGNIPGKEIAEPLSPKFESDGDASEDSDQKDENGTQTTSETPSVRQSSRTAGRTMRYTELSSGGDSSDSDNEIEVPEDVDEKRSTRSPKGSPAPKGPAAKKQRASLKEKQPTGKKASGTQKKHTPKVEEDEIEELSGSSEEKSADDDSDEDWEE